MEESKKNLVVWYKTKKAKVTFCVLTVMEL